MKMWIFVAHTKVNSILFQKCLSLFIGGHCHDACMEVRRSCESRFFSSNTWGEQTHQLGRKLFYLMSRLTQEVFLHFCIRVYPLWISDRQSYGVKTKPT